MICFFWGIPKWWCLLKDFILDFPLWDGEKHAERMGFKEFSLIFLKIFSSKLFGWIGFAPLPYEIRGTRPGIFLFLVIDFSWGSRNLMSEWIIFDQLPWQLQEYWNPMQVNPCFFGNAEDFQSSINHLTSSPLFFGGWGENLGGSSQFFGSFNIF